MPRVVGKGEGGERVAHGGAPGVPGDGFQLRRRPCVSPQARPLLTHGTGAIEKNIETVIARRFKRWGMRWTRRGAHRLLKLRLWIARCGSRTGWFEALHSRSTQLTDA